MGWLDRLPVLPHAVPFPRVVRFLLEGLLLGVEGFLRRDTVWRSAEVFVSRSNVVIIVDFGRR